MTWKQRGLVPGGIALLLAASAAIPAGAEPASFSDPDDVNLPLDLKTLTHEHSDTTVTYTVETYEAFEDRQADFKWGLDKNNDGKVDSYVSVEWEDNKLVAKVEDTKENELGPATPQRAGPAALRISFSRDLLGTASYQYWVMAVTDTNGNEEDDPGETDLAPDSGFQPHRL